MVMRLTMMITTTMFSDLERRRKKGGVECVFLVIKYKNCVAENKRTKHISLNIQECVCQPNPDRSNSRPCWRGARRSCPCPHWSSFYLFTYFIYLFIVIIIYLLPLFIYCPCPHWSSSSFSLILMFLLHRCCPALFHNRPKCILTDKHLHSEENG